MALTEDNVVKIVNDSLPTALDVGIGPTESDWALLENLINISFPNNYKVFINELSHLLSPGAILQIPGAVPPSDDSILDVYEYELSTGAWDPDYIPFFDIGNGDYFCFNRKEITTKRVYYYWHDNHDVLTVEYSSFDDWLLDLDSFV